jgi:D-alanyl-D-alanine dipeptidase
MLISIRELVFRSMRRCTTTVALPFLAASVAGQTPGAEKIKFRLVDIRSIDPSIVVELRYAGTHNAMHRPLYPPSMPALIRPGVGQQLADAQRFLRPYKFGLKIWDAYRPESVQSQLWQFTHNDLYVANPEIGVGSLHTWGVAVDATLVDAWGKSVLMPTDFDEFTPVAMLRYPRVDSLIRSHLRLLQIAMGRNGFYGLRTEWWHFCTQKWKKYLASDEVQVTQHSRQPEPGGKL